MSQDQHTHEPQPAENPEIEHEESDVPAGRIATLLIGLLAGVAMVALVLWGAFILLERQAQRSDIVRSPLITTPVVPPEPQLQAVPSRDWQQMLAEETERLNSYGWINQSAGTVHIPIERAMELTLERGLPVRPDATAQPAGQMPGLDNGYNLDSSGGIEPTTPGGSINTYIPRSIPVPQPTAPAAEE
ncbi:hypothetical protein [Kallotenue papyrolyticum]|uniref:hypothetical protein n=1 Tax=Kallotenue papyrolyticum TaxID=1325125 RepID=UPI00049266EC|nr:hypothetical protein [Kallotenue papyrolyticum]